MKTYSNYFIAFLCITFFLSCGPKQEREKGKLYADNSGKKWGYEDHNGNVVIDYKYDEVKEFINGTAPVRIGEDYMIIDQTGKVISKKYKSLRQLKNGYCLAGEYGKRDLLDNSAVLIASGLNNASVYRQDTTFVLVEKNVGGIRGFNLIDKNKKLCLPMWIDEHESFMFQDIDLPADIGGFSNDNESALLISFQKNKQTKYAFMSDKMKLLTDTCYDYGSRMLGGYGYLAKKIGKGIECDFYVFDSTGTNLCKIKAKSIIEIIPEYVLVSVRTTKGECLYDLKTGKKISGPFNQIGEGSTSGGLDFGWSSKTLIKVSYDEPDYKGFSEGMIRFYKTSNKIGFLDSTGKIAIEPTLEGANNFAEGMARVNRFNESVERMEYGYINKSGELIIPYRFIAAEDFKNGSAAVTTTGKKMKIDKTGKEVR